MKKVSIRNLMSAYQAGHQYAVIYNLALGTTVFQPFVGRESACRAALETIGHAVPHGSTGAQEYVKLGQQKPGLFKHSHASRLDTYIPFIALAVFKADNTIPSFAHLLAELDDVEQICFDWMLAQHGQEIADFSVDTLVKAHLQAERESKPDNEVTPDEVVNCLEEIKKAQHIALRFDSENLSQVFCYEHNLITRADITDELSLGKKAYHYFPHLNFL